MKNTDYPIKIENLRIDKKILQFSVTNNTNSTCNIYLNNTLLEKTDKVKTTIKKDLSKLFISILTIKVETKDKFIAKSIKNNLDNYFSSLKKTLKGQDGYFFLVNDRNNEIHLHYDKNYQHNLDVERFRKSILSKKAYLEEKKIKHALFIVPDKSITLRNKLPFVTEDPFRYVDSLDDILYDLNPIIIEEDRFKTDTHISYISSLKVVSFIASILSNKRYEDVFKELTSRTHLVDSVFYGDLFNNQNWSYDRDELFHDNKKRTVKKLELNDSYTKIDPEEIPEKFRHISRRDSLYYRNENSVSSKRAVVLHDSSTLLLVDALVCYYREVFFYWDHWFFNDELIEWFNPDDVIEIRTERFMDSPQYPLVDKNYFANFPISAELKKFNVNKKELNARILIKDYRQLAIKTNIKAFINDVLVSEEDSDSLYYDFTYPLDEYENGEYHLRFEIRTRYKFREVFKDFILEDSLDLLFNDLKLTFKGIGNTFFSVNDNTNELKQHYDKMYVSNFKRKSFINSMNSKIKYLKRMHINYGTFIIPDKSVVLSNYIPFKNNTPHRHVDSLGDVLVDMYDVLCEDDYLLNDTNVSMCAGLSLVSHILSVMDNKLTPDEYKKSILDNVTLIDAKHRGNLFTNRSWSYPDNMDLHDKYYEVDTVRIVNNHAVDVDLSEVPVDFRIFSTTESQYYRNANSISNKKALVLCDDSIKPLIPSLTTYYSEVFLYQDLWYFNKNLVDYLKVDDLLEIRSERTLEQAQYQIVSIEDNFVIPIIRKIERLDIIDGKLNIKIYYNDLTHTPVKSVCIINIDGKTVDTVKIDGVLNESYTTRNGEHSVEIILKATGTTKRNVLKKIVKG